MKGVAGEVVCAALGERTLDKDSLLEESKEKRRERGGDSRDGDSAVQTDKRGERERASSLRLSEEALHSPACGHP